MEKLQHAAGSVPQRAWPAFGWCSHKRQVVILGSAILAVLWLACFPTVQTLFPRHHATGDSVFDEVQRCTIDSLHNDLSFLDQAKPIEADEFISRRDRLAQALASSKVDAFVLEPGYTFQYAIVSIAHKTCNRLADPSPQVLRQHLTDRLGALGA